MKPLPRGCCRVLAPPSKASSNFSCPTLEFTDAQVHLNSESDPAARAKTSSTREAGASIKPGVKRSETPGPRLIRNEAQGVGGSRYAKSDCCQWIAGSKCES